ncbi:GNAT family N-acetyltransferase [Xinfangfangia sp. D13-10-4-6]|nr:GNAT family protein [Pseudogemmobacter hezensis]NPD15868.1 GNAT family N-acetyltransferase [Pseudogemmobacter hezensis]
MAELTAMLDDQDCLILIAEGADCNGIATLRMLYDQVWYLDNLTVTEPGKGDGPRLIRAVTDLLFGSYNAHRIMCDVVFDNPVALKTFLGAGFTHEGNMRQCWKRNGTWVDCDALAMLAPEWRALQA